MSAAALLVGPARVDAVAVLANVTIAAVEKGAAVNGEQKISGAHRERLAVAYPPRRGRRTGHPVIQAVHR
jgi:hypothetical protein